MNFNLAMEKLKSEGFKRTPSREAILRLLEREDRYLSAGDVRKALAEKHPKMSQDTVYRNLSSFSEMKILEETELGGERKFRMHCDRHGHHHHFICMECGRTEKLDICPMEQVTLALPSFIIDDHKFEVYGQCPDCCTAG